MGKITIKHYLNTDLKPSTIRGEKYFSVYMLVTANRKTTRIPSIEFEELCTEKEFERILEEEAEIIENEEKTVSNILETQLNYFNNEFDTKLFCALYNLMRNYRWESNSHSADKIYDMTDFDKYPNGYTYFDFFKPQNQKHIEVELKKITNLSITEINIAVLDCFFEILGIVAKSVKKYRFILDLYEANIISAGIYFENIDVK